MRSIYRVFYRVFLPRPRRLPLQNWYPHIPARMASFLTGANIPQVRDADLPRDLQKNQKIDPYSIVLRK